MSLIDSMQILKDDIKTSRQKRRQDLKSIKHETRELQQDTQRMITEAEKERREEAEAEKRRLAVFKRDLSNDVKVLQKGFRQEQAEVKKEILSAAAVWRGTASVKVRPEEKEEEKA